jgi:hypothetical protein
MTILKRALRGIVQSFLSILYLIQLAQYLANEGQLFLNK